MDYSKLTYRQLFNLYVKEEEKSNVYFLFYRFISVPLLKLMLKLDLSGVVLSYIGLILRIISSVCYLFFFTVPAVILFQLEVMLDMTDGGTARIKKTPSRKGAMLDKIIGRLNFHMTSFAIAFGLFFFYNDFRIIILAVILFSIQNMIYVDRIAFATYYGDERWDLDSKKDKLKNSSRGLTFIIKLLMDIVFFMFPFIVFFPLSIVIPFYYTVIAIELIRWFFDIFYILRLKNVIGKYTKKIRY